MTWLNVKSYFLFNHFKTLQEIGWKTWIIELFYFNFVGTLLVDKRIHDNC